MEARRPIQVREVPEAAGGVPIDFGIGTRRRLRTKERIWNKDCWLVGWLGVMWWVMVWTERGAL